MNLRIFLDRHHVWQSLDPTLDISPYFMKKSILPPIFLSRFFLKDATFYKNASFLLHLVIHPVVICLVIHLII